MLIDHINIKNKNGIGGFVLLMLLIFPSLLALVLVFRYRLRLRNTPSLLVFNKISLGTSLFWGTLFMILGGMICFTFFASGDRTSSSLLIFFGCLLPYTLTGLLLLCYWGAYKGYKEAADVVLQKIAKHEMIDAETFTITTNNHKYTSVSVRKILTDLRDNDIITLNELSETLFSSSIISPELQEWLRNLKSGEQHAPKGNNIAWICPGCGAPNQMTDLCEYCGGAAPKRPANHTPEPLK